MALRDLIQENHNKAENHRFVKVLLSGSISPEIYSDLLFNQLLCYTKLETLAKHYGILDGIEEICRATAIESDFIELQQPSKLYQSTADYAEYLNTLSPQLLMAHIYARHFGDLYGGQMIKKVVPGNASMYSFDDRAGLIAKVRERLSDELGDEANRAIEFNLRLFDEIADAHNIPAA